MVVAVVVVVVVDEGVVVVGNVAVDYWDTDAGHRKTYLAAAAFVQGIGGRCEGIHKTHSGIDYQLVVVEAYLRGHRIVSCHALLRQE